MIWKILQKILQQKKRTVIEEEEELNKDDRELTILKSAVVKAIKNTGRKTAIGDDNTPVDLLKELEETN